MKIKQGDTRIVILIPLLGIAIKIAKINFLKGLKTLLIYPFDSWKTGGLKNAWRWFSRNLIWDSRSLGSFRFFWFRGINQNWQEFWFYITTKHPLLQPTYCSFLGLFNIQKIASRPLTTKNDLYKQFRILCEKTEGEHHFDNPDNFCLENNRVKFLDYGDKLVREVILESGDSIHREFDPNWDPRKK